ncbi:MAG TPA: hypothetical protein VFR81_22080 [Longimicrobium sp.]|nr:hypothetical protein [Longimicrobium sp.]
MNIGAHVAINAALVAIAGMAAQQRKLVQRLLDEGATTPERAQTLSKSDARLVRSLMSEGIVVESSPGAFHVDPARYAWWIDPRREREAGKKALLAVGIAIVLIGALLAGVAIGR